MEKILTVEDVAGILKVKLITVREMFRHKRLRAFKVGKAWRTTETMLQEDLAALARGETPAQLPTPGRPEVAPIAPVDAAGGAAERLPKVGQAGAVGSGDEAAVAEKPAKPRRAAKAPKEKPEAGGGDPPEEFLF